MRPEPGTFSNAKRNSLRGNDYRTVHLSLFKTFRFGGRTRLQVRGEFFNVFERFNGNSPRTRNRDAWPFTKTTSPMPRSALMGDGSRQQTMTR